MAILIETSAGELVDKLTILEIKLERLTDPAKRENVRIEWETLDMVRNSSLAESAELSSLTVALKTINEQLWEIEDDIRECERAKDFGERFVELARNVYITNDERARLKREINDLLGSRIVEEKSYAAY